MKMRTIVLSVLIVLFLGIAVYYFVTPADALLHFLPGYEAGVTSPHVKHGLAALLLAVGCGLLLWFSTGKRQAADSEPSEPTE